MRLCGNLTIMGFVAWLILSPDITADPFVALVMSALFIVGVGLTFAKDKDES